ncbi:DNA internalization-related competence protein ComEC/Rec2 [Chloroflexota bacterium]
MPLIYLSCVWVAGIFIGSNLALPLALILTGLIPAPLLFFTRQHRKIIILICLGLMTLFAATTYSYSRLQTVNENDLRFYNDRGTVEIKGLVSKDPDVRDKSTHLNLSVSEIKLDKGWQEVKGTALLYVPGYPRYKYGDMLLAAGRLETPPQLDDFDYKGYLAHQGIYSTMLYPKIEIQDRGQGFKPLEWVHSLRNQMADTLVRILPEPQASLAEAIVLGIRGMVPLPLKTDFIRTGTAHLLAISGLHLSIVAGILLSLGIWLFGRRHYFYIWLALGTIWIYASLTGLHPPVVRGAIMASMFLMAELLGRQRSAITALTFAAAIMAGISPYILGDAAFQLSFLAMAGLVFLFPMFQTLGRKAIKSTLGEEGMGVSLANIVADSFSVTLAAIIAIWPVVAYYFGIISLVGPLATFLALPALPGVIITGALTGILGFIALPVAQAMGWLTWLFLSYIIVTVNGLATPSLSSIEVGSIDASLIWTYYLVLASAIWLKSKRRTNMIHGATTRLKAGLSTSANFISRLPKIWVIPPLLIVAILVSFIAITMPDDKLHISFLDVGEGDAILIQKGSQQVLVDGGSSPQALSLGLGNKMPFWDRTIDLLVSTHPHHDHLAGLVEALQRFQVSQVLYPDLDYNSPVYDAWLNLIEQKNVERTIAQDGQQIDLGDGVIIEVLNPRLTPLTGTEADLDNNSIVLRLSKGDISFLLAADIMQEAEWELLRQRADLTSTVLKVAHHGSNTSSTPEFLAVVAPQIAVISVGDNRYGHPSDDVIERLEERLDPGNIHRTDQHGTIEFITDGERLWVETEFPARSNQH